MTNEYDTLKRISDDWNTNVGLVGDEETCNGPYNITRMVLRALTDELTKESWGVGYSIDIDFIRDIANAKPDPLDELTPEDRLGYAAYYTKCESEERLTGFSANRVYLTSRDKYPATLNLWNTIAAAVIAEYERQKAGAK